jgi:hypothetical protein
MEWRWSRVVDNVSRVIHLMSNVIHLMSDVQVVEEKIVGYYLIGNDLYWNRPIQRVSQTSSEELCNTHSQTTNFKTASVWIDIVSQLCISSQAKRPVA